jgi:hypothetical protein
MVSCRTTPVRSRRRMLAVMSAPEAITSSTPTRSDLVADDPEALMDEVWRLVDRIGVLATDPWRYHVELLREGVERGDLNLVEIGLHRFRDVEPLEDDDD